MESVEEKERETIIGGFETVLFEEKKDQPKNIYMHICIAHGQHGESQGEGSNWVEGGRGRVNGRDL